MVPLGLLGQTLPSQGCCIESHQLIPQMQLGHMEEEAPDSAARGIMVLAASMVQALCESAMSSCHTNGAQTVSLGPDPPVIIQCAH